MNNFQLRISEFKTKRNAGCELRVDSISDCGIKKKERIIGYDCCFYQDSKKKNPKSKIGNGKVLGEKNQTEYRNLNFKLRDVAEGRLARSPGASAHVTKSVMKTELIPSMTSLFEATESKGLKGLK